MRIQTIYPAFMGEVNKYGIGAPCVFIRTAGCNLRCYWKTLGTLCDTPEALEGTAGKDMTIEEIVAEVMKYRLPLVCLTGGEPLLQPEKELMDLFAQLFYKGISVVVETNGSRSIAPFTAFLNVSFVVDYKCSSTGEDQLMSIGNWMCMQADDWLKFVIYNRSDVHQMLRWCEHHKDFRGKVAAGLFWGTKNVSYGTDGEWGLLTEIIRNHPEYGIHLNMQAHKLLCLYDKNIEEAGKIIAPRDL